VQRNTPVLSLFVIAFFSFLTWNCTKIDTTTLGSGLIPAVDNVHTFADTLDINCTQGLFNDSTRLGRNDLHVLGNITNDPIFGKTEASLYLQLKPGFFPFFFGLAGDTINNALSPGTGFDSVILCLSSKSYYGDTSIPQRFTVYQIDNLAEFSDTSTYKFDHQPGILPTPIGTSEAIYPFALKNYTRFYPSPATVRDSVNNQIRIKLTDPAFLDLLTSLTSRDTSANANRIYRSDSIFKERLKGFAVVAEPGQGNGLFYINLNDPGTRLEFHYKKQNNNQRDTSFSSFYFSSGIATSRSAHANHLVRDRTGAEFNPSMPATDAVYIQTTPGSFANLSIPELTNFPNSIIHRAEIFVEQVPSVNPVDNVLTPPLYLYLDLIDTASGNRSKPLYFDLNPTVGYNPDNQLTFFPSGGIDLNYFGGYRRVKDNGSGPLFYYTFNVSRYVQHIVTNGVNNYRMKLYAPFNLNYYGYTVPFNNNIANGRIKVGSGSPGTDVNYRMKMRIVYSKI